jgi:phosphinothricin acetyltransferase
MSAVDVLSETELEVRDALPDDVHAIAAIYAWHVLHGRASFEEVPPTIDEMRQRMKSVAENGLPWLVALYRGIVVGYCYAPLTDRDTPTAIPWKSRFTWMPASPGAVLARH